AFSSRARRHSSYCIGSTRSCSTRPGRSRSAAPSSPTSSRSRQRRRTRSWRSPPRDRKSTRLNSSHVSISYAVFCLKKKKTRNCQRPITHCSKKTASQLQPEPEGHTEIRKGVRINLGREYYEVSAGYTT